MPALYRQTKQTEITAIMTPTASLNADHFASWLASLDCKESSRRAYTHSARRFADWLTENGITQPGRADIIRYRDEMVEKMKATSVNSYLMAIKQFFHWLSAMGLYPDVAKGVKALKVHQGHKNRHFEADEVTEILAGVNVSTLTGKRDLAILALMIATGMRISEIADANIEDFEIIRGIPHIYVKRKGYTDRDFTLKVDSYAYRKIIDYLQARDAGKSGPVFISHSHNGTGERLTTRSISRIAKEAFRSAGYDSSHLTAHSLRHTHAIEEIKAGVPIQQVQANLGHSDISTTMIYLDDYARQTNEGTLLASKALFQGLER